MPNVPEQQIAYFGYGSLVNLATLRTPYISAHRARLKGWRRTWLARPKIEGSFAPVDGLAFLSVEPDPDAEIDGLVIIDLHASLASLDKREALYDRVPIDRTHIRFVDEDPLQQQTPTFLYVAQHPPANKGVRILRSYLDAVLQGYLLHFGEQGVGDFYRTTGNFGCGVLEDREQPIYPRSVSLSDDEIAILAQYSPDTR